MVMILELGIGNVNDLMNILCILISNNLLLKDFVQFVMLVQEKDIMWVVYVDLDYFYDLDLVQEKENLDKLVQWIFDLCVIIVFL